MWLDWLIALCMLKTDMKSQWERPYGMLPYIVGDQVLET